MAESIAALSSSEIQSALFNNVIHSLRFAQMCIVMCFHLQHICRFSGGASVLCIFPWVTFLVLVCRRPAFAPQCFLNLRFPASYAVSLKMQILTWFMPFKGSFNASVQIY